MRTAKPLPPLPDPFEGVKTRNEQIQLLENFCRFMERAGYLDSDWWSEEPLAIDRFMHYQETGKDL